MGRAVLAGAAPDDLAGDDVDEAPVRAWHHAARTLRTAIAEPDCVDVTVRTSSGETSGAALLHELFADHLIHTWDLARAIGADERLDDDLVEACTAWFDAHEQQWRDSGEIGPPAPVRDDVHAQTRLLARFGRAAQPQGGDPDDPRAHDHR